MIRGTKAPHAPKFLELRRNASGQSIVTQIERADVNPAHFFWDGADELVVRQIIGFIQKFLEFFKALVGFRHLHEHVHNGVPSVILNEAFDDVDCVHGLSLADSDFLHRKRIVNQPI